MTAADRSAWDVWPRLRTRCENDALVVDLDGWPLLRVDLAGEAVGVNDLRRRGTVAHLVGLGPLGDAPLAQVVRTIDGEGAVVFHTGSIVDPAACVAVAATPADAVHAEVRVATPASGVRWRRVVRYRQLPAARRRHDPDGGTR